MNMYAGYFGMYGGIDPYGEVAWWIPVLIWFALDDMASPDSDTNYTPEQARGILDQHYTNNAIQTAVIVAPVAVGEEVIENATGIPLDAVDLVKSAGKKLIKAGKELCEEAGERLGKKTLKESSEKTAKEIENLERKRKSMEQALKEDRIQLENGRAQDRMEIEKGRVSNPHGLGKEISKDLPESIRYKEREIDKINKKLNELKPK